MFFLPITEKKDEARRKKSGELIKIPSETSAIANITLERNLSAGGRNIWAYATQAQTFDEECIYNT
jgi:hypothetical protein